MDFLSPSASSVLAFATTLHLSLALLRHHRRQEGAVSPVSLISFSFAALPWLLPTQIGLSVGLAVHVAWFIACERLLPPVLVPAMARARSAAPRSAPAPLKAVAVAAPPKPAPAAAAPRKPAASAPAGRPTGFVHTPVIATFDETSDIKTFRILRPEGFEFEAGQFLAVRIRVDGQEYVRCYSISSAPELRGYLEISVKRQGVVSNALHATARAGSMLSVKAPAGAFRYPSGDDRPILLLAGGIGITPLMCMLRHAVANEPTRPITLIYAAQNESGFAFCDEMAAIARRHPQVRMYFAANDGVTQPHIYRGRIDESLLKTVVPELLHSIAFICGPKPMLEGMRTLLAQLGVPQPQIRFEVFQAAVAVAAGLETERPAAAASASLDQPVEDVVEAPAVTGHEMLCAKTGSQIPVEPGQTLLEAAECAGVDLPSLCRAGVCGTCRVQVTDGDVNCESTMLGDDDRRAGFVLACVTTAKSNCTVQV